MQDEQQKIVRLNQMQETRREIQILVDLQVADQFLVRHVQTVVIVIVDVDVRSREIALHRRAGENVIGLIVFVVDNRACTEIFDVRHAPQPKAVDRPSQGQNAGNQDAQVRAEQLIPGSRVEVLRGKLLVQFVMVPKDDEDDQQRHEVQRELP